MTETSMTEAQSLAWDMMIERERRLLWAMARDLGISEKIWRFDGERRVFVTNEDKAH